MTEPVLGKYLGTSVTKHEISDLVQMGVPSILNHVIKLQGSLLDLNVHMYWYRP